MICGLLSPQEDQAGAGSKHTPNKAHGARGKHEQAVNELVALLAAGHISPGMRQFITASLGEGAAL